MCLFLNEKIGQVENRMWSVNETLDENESELVMSIRQKQMMTVLSIRSDWLIFVQVNGLRNSSLPHTVVCLVHRSCDTPRDAFLFDNHMPQYIPRNFDHKMDCSLPAKQHRAQLRQAKQLVISKIVSELKQERIVNWFSCLRYLCCMWFACIRLNKSEDKNPSKSRYSLCRWTLQPKLDSCQGQHIYSSKSRQSELSKTIWTSAIATN